MIPVKAAPSDRMYFRKPVRKPKAVHYPESDGKPLAETDIHVRAILVNLALLIWHFRDRSDVYVAANNFIYHEEGNNKARFSPDGYVVFGVSNETRNSYLLWKEKKAPAIVFEFTSKKTKKGDAGEKKDLCARLGINEYVMVDPKREYLNPPVQGFRLRNGVYEPIPMAADGTIHSIELRAKLKLDGVLLALYDDVTGERILSEAEFQAKLRREAENNAHEEETKRREEEAKRRAAEVEIARLGEELARFKQQAP